MDARPPQNKSLRGKFVRLLLIVSSLMALATTAIVVLMSAQASAEHFSAVQGHIQDGIVSKGKVLTQNHALALRGLVVDNAFLDIQRLVERAVKDDQDLVYGVFVNSERAALAKSQRGDPVDKAEPPEKDAWQSLGLRENELLVDKPSVQRVTRAGRDLVEVAVPVTSEEGEALGTIRYALSTARMHDALARAKQDSDSRLWRSVWLIVGLVSVVTGLGVMLSRAQAVHITEPVGALTKAAEALAGGDRSVRVNIASGDELSLLGSSFNRMVDELDGSYQKLEQMNRTLEQKVEARTAELALKNRDMRLVLDNVDQGFITLSPNGEMSGERSAIVAEWFGASSQAQTFWDYISHFSRGFAVAFRLAWSQVEDGFLPLEVCLSQMPEQLTQGPRTWSLRYLPFYRDGELEGVLMVIADVTDRLAREREEAEHGELMQGFKKLMLDRSGFTSFLQEATSMVNQVVSPSAAADLPGLKRTLHTLKGNAGVMGLTVVAQLCHALETQLAEEASMTQRTLSELRSRWAAITTHISTFIGASGQRMIEIPESEYAALVSKLSSTDRQSEVLRQLLSWQLEPAQKALLRLGEQGRSLARRLGKGELELDVSGQEVRLDPQQWAPFFAELVHVVRNAVDHGLETPSERLSLGKPAHGTLVLKARVEGDQLTFEVTDDGRGIDWAAVAERAKELGLPHTTQTELVEALCADGVTTRTDADDVSGRGVGMASVRERVRSNGGRIEVRSAKGVGTSWFMRFKWPPRVSERSAQIRPS
jgi:HPt (histidine-containing phosphotransfer) domain-containing protein/HAMP domain-containing protein/two-component sensor histidine kinase